MNLQKVGKFIARMRKKAGLTQSELGETLGVSGKAVSKWERGINAPDITVLVELAKLLDVTATEILIGEKIESDITTETANEIAISSINTYNNYSKKKYMKIIFILVTIIVLILTIFSTTYFITNYNKCFVYKLSSARDDYYLEGLIASNQKENSIIITGIMTDKRINNIEKTNNYKAELFINNYELFKNYYPYNKDDKSKIFDNIDIIISQNHLISWNKEVLIGKSNNNIKLVLTFYEDKEKIEKIIIPIKVEKKFSNDKLFY